MQRIRTRLAVGAALLTLTMTIAGCSSSSDEEEGIDGVASAEPSAQESPSGEAADVAALTELHERYWDAITELENSAELDTHALDGLATQGEIELQLARIQPAKENDVRREGAPVIENVSVSVSGDSARIESCKSEADWQILQNGEVVPDEVPEELRAPHPFGVTAERASDTWLISGTLNVEELTVTC